MKIKLIVTQPFGGYPVGAEITDGKEIETVLAGESSGSVVKVTVLDGTNED